jgi:hypothetical protein
MRTRWPLLRPSLSSRSGDCLSLLGGIFYSVPPRYLNEESSISSSDTTLITTRLLQWPVALPGPSFLTARRILRLFSPLSGICNPQSFRLHCPPPCLIPRRAIRDLASRESERRTSTSWIPETRGKVNVEFLLALRRSEELLARSRTPKSRGTNLTTSLSRSFAPLPLVLPIPRYRRPEAHVPSKELCVTDREKKRRWDPTSSVLATFLLNR